MPSSSDQLTDPSAPLRAYIYDRTSRLIRPAPGAGDQRLENRRFCDRQGWPVVGEYSDPGRSASRYAKKAREDYDAMVAAVRDGGCDVLVIWESSRAYRTTRGYLDLRDLCEARGVLLCYNGRIYDMRRREDRYYTGMDALRNEDEAEAISERNRRTTRLNAERGGPHGRLPYGFRREYDERTGELLRQLPHEAEAEVVRECAERVASGKSLYWVAKDLNARGVPSPGGGSWSPLAVRGILLRPTNVGRRQHQGQVVGDALWDGIVQEDVYNACVRILKDPGRLSHQDSAVKYLLSGVAVCGACLGDAQPRPGLVRPRRNGARWSYTCVECFRVSIRTHVFDDVVTAAVLKYVERPAFAAALVPAGGGEGVRRELARAGAMEAQLMEARELAATLGADGRMVLSAVSLARLEGQLMPRIEAARASARDAGVPEVLRRLAGSRARQVWKDYDLVQRRAAVRAVVRVSLNRAGQGARRVLPGRFTWDWLH